MHSVVVLGDVRTHRWKDENQLTRTTLGGAMMMKDKIDIAIGRIASQSQSSGMNSPTVFSYEDLTPDEIDAAIGFETRTWSIQKKTLQESMFIDESDSERPRLKSHFEVDERSENDPRDFLPISEKLLHALKPYEMIISTSNDGSSDIKYPVPKDSFNHHAGHFDPPKARCQWCPDIVVFDDLAGQLRTIPLPEPLVDDDGVPYHKDVILSTHDKDPKVRYASVIRTVLERIGRASNPEFMRSYYDRKGNKDKSGGPPLEPVLVCSVMYLPPELPSSKFIDKAVKISKSTRKTNPYDTQLFWDVLYSDPQLRRRTVIILDAKELCESGQLAVSFGSSWENTAQDLITEINRNPKFRRYLDFSQVILRIGHTGVLHISRREERESLYQLYFDPCRDDTCWCDPADGVVLGQSSVFVARIVQELIENCNVQNEHPVLQDLASIIGNAIPYAIRECQELINRGIDPNTNGCNRVPGAVIP